MGLQIEQPIGVIRGLFKDFLGFTGHRMPDGSFAVTLVNRALASAIDKHGFKDILYRMMMISHGFLEWRGRMRYDADFEFTKEPLSPVYISRMMQARIMLYKFDGFPMTSKNTIDAEKEFEELISVPKINLLIEATSAPGIKMMETLDGKPLIAVGSGDSIKWMLGEADDMAKLTE